MDSTSVFVSRCLSPHPEAHRCRIRELQEKVATERFGTTRFSDRNVEGRRAEDLKKNKEGVVKGLYVSPDPGLNCEHGSGVIVFGLPSMTLGEFLHINIARNFNLARRTIKLSEDEGLSIGAEYDFAEGVMGFSFVPVKFSPTSGVETTRVRFSTLPPRFSIFFDPQKDPRLVVGNAVNLQAVENIELPTAAQLWEYDTCGFVYRGTTDEDSEVWAVKERGSENMAKLKKSDPDGYYEHMARFLTALAKHAPDYKVLMFVQGKGNRYIRGVIDITWEDAKCSNCLIWPPEQRLIPENVEPEDLGWGKRGFAE